MSSTHDVNVGHGNHHLNGDRHPTAAQGIKRRHLIALRPFVQAVGEHLSERLVLFSQQVSAPLQDPMLESSPANRTHPGLLRGGHSQAGACLSRNASRSVENSCEDNRSLLPQLAQHPLKDMSGHGGTSADGPHIPSPWGKQAIRAALLDSKSATSYSVSMLRWSHGALTATGLNTTKSRNGR